MRKIGNMFKNLYKGNTEQFEKNVMDASHYLATGEVK